MVMSLNYDTYLRGFVAVGIAAVLLLFAFRANADFEGELELVPDDCKSAGLCRLGADFGFVDAAGIGWQATKGLLTDGASIPPWATPIVGDPFEEAFIKAAVIHDHYCDRRVRPWRQTHRVFYEALRVSQVPKGKAGIMYFAVMIGGPKWLKLIKGRPCPVGMDCINQVDISASIPGSAMALGAPGELLIARPDEFGSARFANTMAEKLPELEALGDTLTPEQVEAASAAAMSDDFYYKNGDDVGGNLSVTVGSE
jgi:hypothetical protein